MKKQKTNLQAKIAQLEQALQDSQEREKRALADYQNLVRRNQEERAQFVKLAVLEFVEELLPSLEHLDLAAKQIKNQDLDLVLANFWAKLNQLGLEKFSPQIGDNFDEKQMEVVESQTGGVQNFEPQQSRQKQTQNQKFLVKQSVSPGFKLNGQVIKFAKVVV